MASENRWHKETSIGRRHSNFDGDSTLLVAESTVQEQSMIELLTNVIFMPLLATINQRKKRYKLLVKLDFKSIKKSPTLKTERWWDYFLLNSCKIWFDCPKWVLSSKRHQQNFKSKCCIANSSNSNERTHLSKARNYEPLKWYQLNVI